MAEVKRSAGITGIIAAAALAWLAVALFATYKYFHSTTQETRKDTEGKERTVNVVIDDYQGCYLATGVLAIVASVVCVGAALRQRLKAREAPAAADREASLALLVAGTVSGGILLLIGTRFLVQDFGLLNTWLSEGKAAGVWKPITAMLAMVLGTGLAFAACLPAQAEERNDPGIRRLMRGTNAAVNGLLLLIGLIVLNVLVAVKLPSKLDTTETGFYTLAQSTQGYLRDLDQPITVYSLIRGQSREADDIRWLLQACQEINPARLTVRTFGEQIPPSKIPELRAKFKQVDIEDEGLIVAVGEDESRYSFIPARDMIRFERGREPSSSTEQFVGEAKLIREIMFLAQGKVKPIVYFTQGHGELFLNPKPDENNPARSAQRLRGFLEDANYEVKPLPFDPVNPKLPDDASIIIVADPQFGLRRDLADLLAAFVQQPKPGAKPGKLILLSGPHPAVGGEGVQPTGLESLLQDFGLELQPKYLINEPGQLSPFITLGVTTTTALRARHPTAMMLQDTLIGLPMCRPITFTASNAEYRLLPLLVTPGEDRVTWLDSKMPERPEAEFQAMMRSTPEAESLRRAKNLSAQPRILAAAVTNATGDPPTPRLAVFGFAYSFSDAATRNTPDAARAWQMISTSLDWLRDRPFVEVANKTYGTYAPRAAMDEGRLVLLPLALVVLTFAALGTAIWIIRRS